MNNTPLTPVRVEMLMHARYRTDPYTSEDTSRSAEAALEWGTETGLVEGCSGRRPRLTERGQALVDHILATPCPKPARSGLLTGSCTMKTSELTGPALDWAVAKCEGIEKITRGRLGASYRWDACGRPSEYSPSTDWADGGPIIQQEKITISDALEYWVAGYRGTLEHFGPTPLIAAMRCLVYHKLGGEVDVPDELR